MVKGPKIYSCEFGTPSYASQCFNITGGTYGTFEVQGKFFDAFLSKLVIVENA